MEEIFWSCLVRERTSRTSSSTNSAAPSETHAYAELYRLGIDRTTLCATLFDGRAHAAEGVIPNAHWAHVDAPPLAYRPGRRA